VGILSFNGNKIMTTGGGGMILTDNERLAKRAKHLTTTAKNPHPWQYVHDETGYNYRMPNLNAALGIAQLEQLQGFIKSKRSLAKHYLGWCDAVGIRMMLEPKGAQSNYWLNALVLENHAEREAFLQFTNDRGVMTRPLWEPMHLLPMFKQCHHGPLENADWAMDRVVNIPSSVPGTSTGEFKLE
jgi:dTDP-4-amino-4,6-dideoxygalactose transaminase